MAITIPKEKRKPKTSGIVTFCYGIPGVGKSSFWAEAPWALFATTEPGTQFLEVAEVPINSWADFIELRRKLDALPPEQFKAITHLIIDIVDILYVMCSRAVCQPKNIQHPSDLSYGKGWAMLRDEWRDGIAKFCSVGMSRGFERRNIVFISHAVVRDLEQKGKKISVTQPSITEAGRRVVSALCDQILYFTTAEKANERICIAEPSQYIEAKDRTGTLPPEFSLGDSPKAGYDLYNAFLTGKEDKDKYYETRQTQENNNGPTE